MKVGFYSPLPPSLTGVADYSSALLNQLRQYGDIEVAPSTCDAALYHIGNNALHRSQYDRATNIPGVVVIHDACLHHFYLGSFSRTQYLEEFVFNYGAFAQQEGETLWRERALSSQDPRYFKRPMLRRIAETAQAVVVHNAAAAESIRDHAPTANITEIPHFVEQIACPDRIQIAQFRERLSIPAGAFVFGCFGFLRETKRIRTILRAFNRLKSFIPNLYLLLAGRFVSQDLERDVLPLIGGPGIVRLPYFSPADFHLAIHSVDCCLNLRYPSAGESSGVALRLMGAGKPVIATEGSEWSRLPEAALFRIPAGTAEPEALFSAMFALQQRPELARTMGEVAADHIRRYHSITVAAEQYWKLLCRTSALSP